MSSAYKDMVKPFLVLVVICLVTGALLGFANMLTAPIIEENARIAAEETIKSVLPGATGFTEIPVEEGWNVDSVYKDEGGCGYVIAASSKGYGGSVVVTIGFTTDGVISNMSVDASTETQGVGSKTANADNIAKYLGRSSDVGNDGSLLITGATFSSKAVRTAVQNAMDVFKLVKEAEA